jgi:hypothetical protein
MKNEASTISNQSINQSSGGEGSKVFHTLNMVGAKNDPHLQSDVKVVDGQTPSFLMHLFFHVKKLKKQSKQPIRKIDNRQHRRIASSHLIIRTTENHDARNITPTEQSQKNWSQISLHAPN